MKMMFSIRKGLRPPRGPFFRSCPPRRGESRLGLDSFLTFLQCNFPSDGGGGSTTTTTTCCTKGIPSRWRPTGGRGFAGVQSSVDCWMLSQLSLPRLAISPPLITSDLWTCTELCAAFNDIEVSPSCSSRGGEAMHLEYTIQCKAIGRTELAQKVYSKIELQGSRTKADDEAWKRKRKARQGKKVDAELDRVRETDPQPNQGEGARQRWAARRAGKNAPRTRRLCTAPCGTTV